MELYEETLEKDCLYSGKIIDLELHKVSLPNGRITKREIVRHKECVSMLALDDEKNVYLVEQYRKPIDSVILEIPAGHIEEGETPEQAAIRELEEEIGMTAKSIEYINKYYTSPGFSDELIYFYVVHVKSPDRQNLDDDEFINIKKMPVKDFVKLVDEHKITDEKAILAAYFYAAKYGV